MKDNWVKDLSSFLFWEIDLTDIDLSLHSRQIIERVILKGTWQDFKILKNNINESELLVQLQNIRYLDNKTLAFCAFYFNVPKESFRCYTEKLSYPEHYNY